MEHEQQHPTEPTFDTLKAAEALEKVGFTGAQAKAVTHIIVEAQANLATKADLREFQAEVRGEFKALRADNQRLLAAFESHVAVLRAENKRMEETLRAENKRMEETLRADMAGLRADNKRMEETLRADNEQLKEKVNTNRVLIFSIGVPVLLALVGLTFAVVSLSLR
ncbi:MAG: hypothetical protein OXU65_05235 [Deltaproteobacteria bacterium]|nr:hypothetical protein [Deltaproteobacteria bacterium]